MATSLYKVTLKGNRVFKVFCENKKQKERFQMSIYRIKYQSVEEIENGIHNIKQWEDTIKNIS